MSVLSKIKLPKDLKKLSFSELQKLNDELRDLQAREIINLIEKNISIDPF